MERIANATERMLPILRRIEDQSDAMTKDIIGIFAALDTYVRYLTGIDTERWGNR